MKSTDLRSLHGKKAAKETFDEANVQRRRRIYNVDDIIRSDTMALFPRQCGGGMPPMDQLAPAPRESLETYYFGHGGMCQAATANMMQHPIGVASSSSSVPFMHVQMLHYMLQQKDQLIFLMFLILALETLLLFKRA
jgi:hypothetical protein